MPALILLLLSLRFKIGPKGCSDLPSFRQFISQFLNNEQTGIYRRPCHINWIEGGALLFGVVYEGK